MGIYKNRNKSRDNWIRENGSDRLKKALELGLVESCRGLYRDERLAEELPGWRRDNLNSKHEDVRNPSMAALLAYEQALELDTIEDPQLVFVKWTEGEHRCKGIAIWAKADFLDCEVYLFIGEPKRQPLRPNEWR